jgi:hypothetical protein
MNIRRAQAGESGLVAQVLAAAAENLALRGEPLWAPAEVSAAAIEGDVNAGMYFIASDGAGPVAVYRFQLEDPCYWPEIAEGSSACVGGRPKLRAVYERFGFRHHSQHRMGPSVADRFELEL